VTSKTFTLGELVDWLEEWLEEREWHLDEYCLMFATEERYVEVSIGDDGVWAGAVTNHNLSEGEWISGSDESTLHKLGWVAEEVGGPEPKYVRRWSMDGLTADIVARVLQILTLVYLPADTDEVEVMRDTFVGDRADESN
jgi:hypothetical protein